MFSAEKLTSSKQKIWNRVVCQRSEKKEEQNIQEIKRSQFIGR